MDPIANMIVQIKNAGDSGHENVVLPFSKVKSSIAEALKKEGFIKDVEVKKQKGRPALSLDLYIENRIPKIKGVKRISKTSKRVYLKSSLIRSVKNGYGATILSTPKGIMSDREARREKVGGEALFSIW